jgi:hypothetical protein
MPTQTVTLFLPTSEHIITSRKYRYFWFSWKRQAGYPPQNKQRRNICNFLIEESETQKCEGLVGCYGGCTAQVDDGRSQPTENKGHSHAAVTCGHGIHDATFYLIASQTINSTTDVVHLVVNSGAIMLGPAELNHIFTCAFQPPHPDVFKKILTLLLPIPNRLYSL